MTGDLIEKDEDPIRVCCFAECDALRGGISLPMITFAYFDSRRTNRTQVNVLRRIL